MKKSEKKVKKKKSNKSYVYHVTDLMYWQVMILRYELVRQTAKKVIVLDSTKKEKTFPIAEEDGKICFTKEEALEVAKQYIKKRKALMKKYKKQLDDSAAEIKEGKVRIIKPRELKIDPNDIQV